MFWIHSIVVVLGAAHSPQGRECDVELLLSTGICDRRVPGLEATRTFVVKLGQVLELLQHFQRVGAGGGRCCDIVVGSQFEIMAGRRHIVSDPDRENFL